MLKTAPALRRHWQNCRPRGAPGLVCGGKILWPQVQFHWRKAQFLRLGVVIQEQVLAPPVIDADSNQQHVSSHPSCQNLMAMDRAVLVLVAIGAPVLLKAIEVVRSAFLRMRLPVAIVDP